MVKVTGSAQSCVADLPQTAPPETVRELRLLYTFSVVVVHVCNAVSFVVSTSESLSDARLLRPPFHLIPDSLRFLPRDLFFSFCCHQFTGTSQFREILIARREELETVERSSVFSLWVFRLSSIK